MSQDSGLYVKERSHSRRATSGRSRLESMRIAVGSRAMVRSNRFNCSCTAFTAFVTDVCSRRIVGWRTASRMPTELPLDALEMALWTRAREGATDKPGRLQGLVQHSDAGSQYVAFRNTERLTAAGAVASIGSVGDSYDNALAEPVIGLYKNECVKHDGPCRTVDDLELGTLSLVHWFNYQRLHSSIGYMTPMEFEQEYYRQNTTQERPHPGELALH